MQSMAEYHIPVMAKECIDALAIQPEGTYVDATFGGGGHAAEILVRLGEKGKLIAFDKDEDALLNAPRMERLILVHHDYAYMKNYLRYLGTIPVQGILADLGISSHQVDTADRGFSFRYDAALDMRMDADLELTAATLLNTYKEKDLQQVFGMLGEVPNARTLAEEVVRRRQIAEIGTTGELVDIAGAVCPASVPEKKYLAQVFQALRIEVNQELENLKSFLEQAAAVLAPGGRLVVLTYHSLEDRLVKNFFRTGKFRGNEDKDIFGNVRKPLRQLHSKPLIPSVEEVVLNPRARSAKLRVAEKLK